MLGGTQDHGSASSIGLIVAAATFMGAFVFAQTMVAEPGGMDPRPAALEQQAVTALDLIVQQSGKGATADWGTSPDGLQRFGLAKGGEPNFLDYVKIKALRNGTMTSASNNAPDYPEARRALGISTGDFHLRSYPVLPDLDDPRWTKDPRGRIAYVGHVASGSPPGQGTLTATATVVGTTLNITMTVTNTGPTSYVFVASASVDESGTVPKADERHTRLLAPGGTQDLWIEVPRISGSPAPSEVELSLVDAKGITVVPEFEISTSAPPAGSVTYGLVLSAGAPYYVTGDSVKFHADHYRGDGSRFNSGQAARFVLVGPDGHEWTNASVTLPKNKPYTYTCANCTTGSYVATLWTPGLDRKASDMVHVAATELSASGSSLAAAATKESQIIDELVANFDATVYDETTNPAGDIFVDDGKARDLPPVLSRYTTLIVGSEVDQTTLNSGDIKWEIRDWVLAGGNLVALGRTSGHTNWLQPVYGASQATANGAISAPDATHPVLTTPNRVDYQRYVDRGMAWSVENDQPFAHILTRGTNAQSTDDALAVSAPGAYNDGTVVLTSYMPGDLTSPQDDMEAKRFLHNLMSQSYNMLFLDYGPPVPPGVPVGAAQRLVAIPHPNVPGAVVEAKIVLYLFGS